jgi:hypothetical protein
VTLEEIRQMLHDGAALRMPRFSPDSTSRERVEALEEYLNLTAVTRGDLEEARLYAQGVVLDLGRQWDAIEGWEPHLRRRRADATQADIAAAKSEINPGLHGALTEARWLVARLGEQIDRLSHMGDDQVASRIYTLITGG